MIVGFAIASVSVVPMRALGCHQSEQVSQLLFGERMIVLSKSKNGWLLVRTEWDKYDGYILEGQVNYITERTYKRKLGAISKSMQDFISIPDGRFLLSPGSSLFLLKGKSFLWNEHYLFKGKKRKLKESQFDPERLREISKLFLGTPYVWGGKSAFGIDCSGLAQIVFKLFNYKLPRDASQQAKVGLHIDFLQEAQTGDLAFFDNEEGNINHVGILLNDNLIIHATEVSGCVVIDYIDNSGIINREKRIRTHNLRLIKRYFGSFE